MERGHLRVLKATSPTPIVVQRLSRSADTFVKVLSRLRKSVHLDEEELTMEKLAAKTRETLRIIDKIEKLYQTGLKQAASYRVRQDRISAICAGPESVTADPG